MSNLPPTLRVGSRNARFQQWEALLGNRTKRQRAGEFIVQGVRPVNLALDNGWKQERNIDLMVKYTGAKADVIRRARAHVLDPNLDMDPAVLESMQRLSGEMGFLKYKDLLPVSKLFNFAYRDRAVAELGKK